MSKSKHTVVNRKRLAFIIGLLLLALGIFLWSAFPAAVEQSYVHGFYPFYARIQRIMMGWSPISIGDLIYGVAGIYFIYKVVKWIYRVINRKQYYLSKGVFQRKFVTTLMALLVIYNVFNLSWGLNYNRKPVGITMGILPVTFADSDMNIINARLVEKVNTYKERADIQAPLSGFSVIKRHVVIAYDSLEKKTGIKRPKPTSLKPSLWGWLGNYSGFTGYYNPFTGEAQINTTVPEFLQPFVALHEVAHQQGFAKEDEASFVGFLAAKASQDDLLLYSTYLELFLYANRNLSFYDSTGAKGYRSQLSKPVQKDLSIWRKFNEEHQSIMEPVVAYLYEKFLQSNEQPKGLRSYDAVTTLMIAYYKKYGEL